MKMRFLCNLNFFLRRLGSLVRIAEIPKGYDEDSCAFFTTLGAGNFSPHLGSQRNVLLPSSFLLPLDLLILSVMKHDGGTPLFWPAGKSLCLEVAIPSVHAPHSYCSTVS